MMHVMCTFMWILVSNIACSQSVLNTGFEEVYPQTTIAAQWKTMVDNAIYEVDDQSPFSGKYAYKIISPSDNYSKLAYVEIGQLFGQMLHKTIRIELKAKWDPTQTKLPDFTLDLRLNGKDTTLTSTIGGPINDWRLFYMECYLDGPQERVYLSIRNHDKGTVWFDDIRILADGREISYKMDEVKFDFSKKDILPVRVSQSNNYIFPKTFVKTLSLKRIIGVGEGTHGSHEFRLIQQSIVRIIQASRQDLIIAIEASASDCFRLNEYILKGNGEPISMLREMNTNHFKYFCTQDFLAFVEWLRAENIKRKVKIKLYGVDVQYNNNAPRWITKDAGTSFLDTIQAICMRNRYFYPNDLNKNELGKLEGHLINLMAYTSTRANTHFDDYYLAHSLYLQFLGQKNYLQDRDSLMAENIIALSTHFPKHQIVFLANNTHCSTEANYGGQGIKMAGYFLRKRFGQDYLTIGTCSNTGFYTAQDFAKESKVMDAKGFFTSTEFTSKNVTATNMLHLAPKTSIEHYLSQFGFKIAVAKLNPNKAQKMVIRDIGLVKRDCEQFAQTTSDVFDYLLYFDYVQPTTLISY